MVTTTDRLLPLAAVIKASARLKGIVQRTPLLEYPELAKDYHCRLWLKREDLQIVRSYKIRGAYNRISQLQADERKAGVVCASAGNHAQGVAYACRELNIQGTIFMPNPTPRQKVKKVQSFGGEWVDIVITGDTFDEAYEAAKEHREVHGSAFVHPFDDPEVMAGQGTVGLEILADMHEPIDYVFVPIGGGGLSAGLGSYLKRVQPGIKIIGVEPAGAPAMYRSRQANHPVKLDKIDKFVDGAAVQQVGGHTFEVCQEALDEVVLVPEGKVCSTILELYNEEAIVAEPAGALALAALDQFKAQIKGKNVVCVLSGGNNDIMRMEDIKERSLLYEGLKHYFLIRFPQRAGALRDFLNHVLGPNDDIAHFEYTKKNNRETGPALVGIEVEKSEDYDALLRRMEQHRVNYEVLNDKPMLFQMLV
ncbi:MAG: threonine ammonia-lyase IlvA [Bacteroidota bacterium]